MHITGDGLPPGFDAPWSIESMIADLDRLQELAAAPVLSALRSPTTIDQKLSGIVMWMRAGMLDEAGALKMLHTVIDDHAQVVIRELSCPMCQRRFGRVASREGASVEAVCDGCEREGRR